MCIWGRVLCAYVGYQYTEDLLQLERCRPAEGGRVPDCLSLSASPLQWESWSHALRNHPDRQFTRYIVEGIRDGFRIGYIGRRSRYGGAQANMGSAREHPEVVREYLTEECGEGRLVGPLPLEAIPEVRISRFGVIPKGTTGRWRLIVDLSSPEGTSVNDGIDPKLCSLSYVSVEDAARMVVESGRGAYLAKADIKQAYRMVPVHPQDRHLLGMVWDGSLFVDSALPFGLRSAPKIFNAIADALQWLIKREGTERILHYLDDFLIVAGSHRECREGSRTLRRVFNELRVPLAPHKVEGPATTLTFLGIELDSVAAELRLPQAKLRELKVLVATWLTKRFCTVRELESLIGKLQHATKVVRPGRTFLRRMFELKGSARKGQRFIRLNASFKSDLAWWHFFMEQWNGVAMLRDPEGQAPGQHIFSDASGSFGCGAWWESMWFQIAWTGGMEGTSIAFKELVPIVVACMLWGREWKGQVVLAHCDNMAVVEVVNAGYSKDKMLMHLVRTLFWVQAYLQVVVKAEHIPGYRNGPADAISRNNLSSFFAQVPGAARTPTQVPREAVRLLCVTRLDWLSPTWGRQLVSCLRQDWRSQPEGPTAQVPEGMRTSARGWEHPHSQ